MKYLSVCSGIEAATVAWHPLGWEPVGFAEIEPFPAAVLAHHYPKIPNFGDMTKYKEWNLEIGTVDLLVGGTPCQSFSVAGLRKGLEDPRGNLSLVYCGILDHFRPKWFVWENVPGVLSSNGGRDFGSFLGALAELGYGFAYRVLDAQYFGVAQRRRRVFVVGYFGDWRPAAEVLFERESVLGNPAPSREAGQKVAPTIAARFGVSRNNHEELAWDENGIQRTVGTLCADTHPGAYSGQDAYTGRLVPHTFSTPAIGHIVPDDIASTITKNTGGGGETQNPAYVAQPITFGAQMSTPQTDVDLVQTLQAKNPMAVAQPIAWSEELTASIDVAGTIQYGGQGGRHDGVMANMAVRRLTPVECERLQGFPDNYTNIPWRKADQSPDGPRYKALGNSMAVPVMKWIGDRIKLMMLKPTS